jgi:hypothetical protein
MDEQPMEVIRLALGTRRFVPVTPRATILVRQGRVALRAPPEWLADNCTRSEYCLDAEEVYTATVVGWVDLMALTSAEVMLIPARPRPGLLWRWLRRLFDRVGSRFRRAWCD